MSDEADKKVYKKYDKIADWFDTTRSKNLKQEKKYLELLADNIPSGGSILDLGCGAGDPIAKFYLERAYQITGVDGSAHMIDKCKLRFPDSDWIVSDMCTLDLETKFDAIIAWHSFFHLDHDSQRGMFKVFDKHIKAGGILIFTSGVEHSREIWAR